MRPAREMKAGAVLLVVKKVEAYINAGKEFLTNRKWASDDDRKLVTRVDDMFTTSPRLCRLVDDVCLG